MAEDRYANILAASVTESGANTLTFQEILLPVSLATRQGILIDEIRYYPGFAALNDLVADGDVLTMGITTSDGVTSLGDPADRRVLDVCLLIGTVNGAPASGFISKVPIIHQLFPPMIYAGQRLYLAVAGTSLAAAAAVSMRLHYRFLALNAQEYLEIAETFQLSS